MIVLSTTSDTIMQSNSKPDPLVSIPLDVSMEEKAAGEIYSPPLLTEDEILERARRSPTECTSTVFITFGPADNDNPYNWSTFRKWYIILVVGLLNVLTVFCAGGYSSGVAELTAEFKAPRILGTLGLSLYLLGFALGPLFLAPLSEAWGRNAIYLSTWFILVLLQIPAALAPNMASLIVVRFLAGLFGSGPLANLAGTISDLWPRDDNGNAMIIFGLASTLTPPLALVMSGYIALAVGWRKLFWVFMGVLGAAGLLMAATVPETSHSILLARKASRVRKVLCREGLDDAAEHVEDAEAAHRKDYSTLFHTTLTRPIKFLFTEPITFSAAIYNGFVYGIVFLFNEAFPLVFGRLHDFNTGEWGLSFLGLCAGSLLGALLYPIQERHYKSTLKHSDESGIKGRPEERMWLARFGTFLLPLSLFIFAWTSSRSIHWIVPIIASIPFGTGLFIAIVAILNYVVDSYQEYAASAIAGIMFVRNLVGAAFPLFAVAMYEKLGYRWASSLLAFLSLPLCLIPWVFYYWGERIRRRSPWVMANFK